MSQQKNPLGQYFTPRHVAEFMVQLLATRTDGKVLEPSAGAGVFVAALNAAGYSNITAVEIDQEIVDYTCQSLHLASFVSWTQNEQFDAIIGNPPYIRWKNLGDDERAEIQLSPYWGKLLNSLADYLMVFIVKAVDLLRSGGELIFITPSFWFHTQHSQAVRDYLLEHGSFSNVIQFGEAKVFDGVSSAIVIFRYVKDLDASHQINYHTYVGPRKIPANLGLDDPTQFSSTAIPQFRVNSHWTLATHDEQRRQDDFENWANSSSAVQSTLFDTEQALSLGEFVTIANGMVSGLDRAFRAPDELLESLSDRERTAIRKVSKAADLQRLFTRKFSLYIDLPSGLSQTEVRTKFPRIYRHLTKFREQLEARYSYDRELPFWEWAFRRSEKFFLDESSKLFVPCKERLTNKTHVRFSLTVRDTIATQDVSAISPHKDTRESIEYFAAFLTLDEVTDWVRQRGLMKGGIAEFSERPIAAIPFRSIDWTNDREIAAHNEITNIVKGVRRGGVGESSFQQIRRVFETELGLAPKHS